MKQDCKIETICVHGNSYFEERTGAISFPIYQSATFRHPALNETTGYDYSRQQNPTREELEKTIALLENGENGLAFSTGMAAITAILTLFNSGDHLVVTDDLYGGTYRLFETLFKKYGISVTYTDTRYIENIEREIKENTKAIYIESPSNPMMKISDLKKIAEIAKKNNILLIADNTFLSPYFQKPLDLGAHIVVHSGTKYIGGHNDTLAGFIVVNDKELTDKLRLIQKSIGAVPGPFDSWLMLRGIKTLGIRMERQQENAMKIAKWLEGQQNVEKVYYAGLETHENHQVLVDNATGFGAMISFRVLNRELVEKVLKSVKVIAFAESLGGVESLITYPVVQTHADIPLDIRNALGVDDRLLRLSVGIENADDLIKDLEQALGVDNK